MMNGVGEDSSSSCALQDVAFLKVQNIFVACCGGVFAPTVQHICATALEALQSQTLQARASLDGN